MEGSLPSCCGGCLRSWFALIAFLRCKSVDRVCVPVLQVAVAFSAFEGFSFQEDLVLFFVPVVVVQKDLPGDLLRPPKDGMSFFQC